MIYFFAYYLFLYYIFLLKPNSSTGIIVKMADSVTPNLYRLEYVELVMLNFI
jgi:hypothetical protein